jgi:U3 small nucleolar RNA-associated protein 19
VRVAVQALKLHFIAAFDAGDVPRAAKRPRPDAPPPAASDADAAAPQPPRQLQQQQLADGYAAFGTRLLRLLVGPAPPGLQVAALSALMECARHEEGPGTCSGRAVEAVVNAAVRGATVAPEVFALLFSRYLPHLDVRYHALKAAGRLAARMAQAAEAARAGKGKQQRGGGGPAPGAAVKGQGQQLSAAAEEEEEERAAGGQGGAPPTPDAVRSLFDVLAHVAPLRPGDDLSGATSWCGAAEVRRRGARAPQPMGQGARPRPPALP